MSVKIFVLIAVLGSLGALAWVLSENGISAEAPKEAVKAKAPESEKASTDVLVERWFRYSEAIGNLNTQYQMIPQKVKELSDGKLQIEATLKSRCPQKEKLIEKECAQWAAEAKAKTK